MTNGVAFDLKKIKPIGKRYQYHVRLEENGRRLAV